jgi:hypothetical protein
MALQIIGASENVGALKYCPFQANIYIYTRLLCWYARVGHPKVLVIFEQGTVRESEKSPLVDETVV